MKRMLSFIVDFLIEFDRIRAATSAARFNDYTKVKKIMLGDRKNAGCL